MDARLRDFDVCKLQALIWQIVNLCVNRLDSFETYFEALLGAPRVVLFLEFE